MGEAPMGEAPMGEASVGEASMGEAPVGEVILRAVSACYTYPGTSFSAVHSVDFEIERGEMVAIVGPNGSGKTTLLRMLLGTVEPSAGEVTFGDRRAHQWPRQDLARKAAVVTQSEEPTFPLRVRDAVMLGRYPHLKGFGPGRDDVSAVNDAMERADIVYLENRWTQTLSGGEWQRVRLARALAQQPELLVLDEPTANLDLRHEMEVFEVAAELVKEGMAALTVTHNVNLAARFADKVMVLNKARAVAVGPPAEVLTAELLGEVFGWPVERFEWNGLAQFIPMRKTEG
jgi:iron complex transport system ATP-binding protein